MWTFNGDTLSLKSCELQKLIPNHQFSFCWIYLLFLTLLTIRLSWPPSHHWASQGFHFAVLNPILMAGLSRWPGEVRYPQNINWSLGYLRDRFLDPSSSPHTLHHWVPSYKHMVSYIIALLMTHSSISHFDPMIQWYQRFRLPGGLLGADERTSPTAQPGKDWASCLSCPSKSTAWFHHPARFLYNYPIKFGQKSWCNFRWPADFQRPHCKNCSILQVCIAQHQKDQALPYTACSTTYCPGPCHF